MKSLEPEEYLLMQGMGSDLNLKLITEVPGLGPSSQSIYLMSLAGSYVGGVHIYEEKCFFIEYRHNGLENQYKDYSIFNLDHPGMIVCYHLDGRLDLIKDGKMKTLSVEDLIDELKAWVATEEYQDYFKFKAFI